MDADGRLADRRGPVRGLGADGPARPGRPVRRRPGLLRIAARRAYAAEAAAAQTGVGSASSRGLIGAVRRADVHAVERSSPTVAIDVDAGCSGRAGGAGVDADPGCGAGDGGLGLAGPAAARGDGVRGRRGEHVAAVPVGDGRARDRGAGGDLVGAGAADARVGSGVPAGGAGDRGGGADRPARRGRRPAATGS